MVMKIGLKWNIDHIDNDKNKARPRQGHKEI